MRTVLVLLLLISTSHLFSQTAINLTLLNDTTNLDVVAYLPVSGRFFQANKVRIPAADNGVFRVVSESEQPGFCYLYGNFSKEETKKWLQIFLEPGDQYDVIIDAAAENRLVSIKGPAVGLNRFLNAQIRGDVRFPWLYSTLTPFLADSTSSKVFALMAVAEKNDIMNLLVVPGLTEEQKHYAVTDIRLYYKSLLKQASTLTGNYDENEEFNVAKDWYLLLNKIVEEEELTEYAMASKWHPRLLDLKKFLALKRRAQKISEVLKKRDNNAYYWALDRLLLSGPELEPALAISLATLINDYPFEPSTIKSYLDFVELFPASPFLPFVKKMLNEALSEQVDSKLTTALRPTLDTTAYKTLGEVLAVSDKPFIYIDLWATWCAPCKQQFTKKSKLDAFIDAYSDKIETLYISLDESETDNVAIERIVSFYELTGRHIRAKDALRNALLATFGHGEDYALTIPRYMIASRTGEIINAKASRPEDWLLLRKELIEAFTRQ